MDFTPTIIHSAPLRGGRFELVEWQWPDLIDFMVSEPSLMLEMSLPPLATDASAEFPDIDRGNRCFMGTLFIRYPGVMVHGRGQGGHIRVLRAIFSGQLAASILGSGGVPPVQVLQGLLDIRNDALRTMMRLAARELTTSEARSPEAMEALHMLVAVELRRLFDRQVHASTGGRLASWQYRRIRERLMESDLSPSISELAALCGISVRHLHRQFHALTGSNVADYVENFRMNRAQTLLSQPDLPIKIIAARLGFAHPNSFARAFRRVTGMTPLRYRQSMLGGVVTEEEEDVLSP
ncbi:hypothetical protein L288_16470 [Sphingobium quisquiliarum P25]|uniref:HTH araC/xylS-type domain-containing protein n=1 Tax=Sphingobium quisquiliarum P25 TaxID=1329909 RepID=T0HYI4_9SPHN|nr:helix-turn-helix domain-containing protein [Sphingobium quisquiliarum]EQB02589.1 hypothetical protein L288_16470 [Sphingobium quisquiliarum P25]